MADPSLNYEVRCPVHGFIPFSDWEREIINQPAFQRLRRIRQLAWTDYVYPGATHTRFEHSLGVMHVATRLFDAIVRNSFDILEREYKYASPDDAGLRRARTIVRLSALLHDTGHSPFSHAGEHIFPVDPHDIRKKPFKHEAYSAAAIRFALKDVIENHPENEFKVTAEEIAASWRGLLRPSANWRSGGNSSIRRWTRTGWTICFGILFTSGSTTVATIGDGC